MNGRRKKIAAGLVVEMPCQRFMENTDHHFTQNKRNVIIRRQFFFSVFFCFENKFWRSAYLLFGIFNFLLKLRRYVSLFCVLKKNSSNEIFERFFKLFLLLRWRPPSYVEVCVSSEHKFNMDSCANVVL